MFKFFASLSFESPVNAATLQTILDEIVNTRLEKKGFAKRGKYSWRKDSVPFRQGIGYTRLKGESGTFTWGVNIDFIPVVRANKIEYYKTEKRFIMHLWEGTDEYRNSFSGGEITKGIAAHRGIKEAKKTIKNLFDRYEEKFFEWFDKANSIEGLIDITFKQAEQKNFYNIHFPRPQYVLAFLYAKANMIDKALELFESLDMYQFNHDKDLREKVKQKLISL